MLIKTQKDTCIHPYVDSSFIHTRTYMSGSLTLTSVDAHGNMYTFTFAHFSSYVDIFFFDSSLWFSSPPSLCLFASQLSPRLAVRTLPEFPLNRLHFAKSSLKCSLTPLFPCIELLIIMGNAGASLLQFKHFKALARYIVPEGLREGRLISFAGAVFPPFIAGLLWRNVEKEIG